MTLPHLRAAVPPLLLLVLLIAFPQLSETLYAPVLPHIATAFEVPAATAQLTMSVYFLAFALGVVAWGRMADKRGRRPAMLAGLACYLLGAVLALVAPSFWLLLVSRFLLAFGASAGSVVVQTVLRDRYHGAQLAGVFSIIGATLSLSPAFGPPTGALLAQRFGHIGVFGFLALMGIGLLLATLRWLAETRPGPSSTDGAAAALSVVARRVATDGRLWIAACHVAGFNVILFGYYTLAPFTLQQLGWSGWVFGLTGLAVALGSVLGAWINRRLLRQHAPVQLVRFAVLASAVVSAMQVVWVFVANEQPNWVLGGLVLFQFLLMLAYGCAIPNLLATALDGYSEVRGTAAALFGLTYYLMLAAGLGLLSLFHRPSVLYQPVAILVVAMLLALTLVRFGSASPEVRCER